MRKTNVVCEDGFELKYYCGDRIDITTNKFGDELTVKVYKPGRYKTDKGYANFPVIEFNLQGSIVINFYFQEDLKRAISKAISMLNREKEGKINTAYINETDLGFLETAIEYPKKLKKSSKNTASEKHKQKE